MKKFLKILLIIVGIVFLIFAALICIGLFVDYDDHIENGRYTYVPEDDNKDNAYVEFNLSDYDKKDSELIYYNSIEEAILNSPLKAEHEDLSAPEDFLNHRIPRRARRARRACRSRPTNGCVHVNRYNACGKTYHSGAFFSIRTAPEPGIFAHFLNIA